MNNSGQSDVWHHSNTEHVQVSLQQDTKSLQIATKIHQRLEEEYMLQWGCDGKTAARWKDRLSNETTT